MEFAGRIGLFTRSCFRCNSSSTPKMSHLSVQNAKFLWKGIWWAWTGSGGPHAHRDQSPVGVGGGGGKWYKLHNSGLTFVLYGGSSQRSVTPQEMFSVKLIDTLYLDDHYWGFNPRLICSFVLLHACFCLYSDMRLFHFSTFNFIISLVNNE